jgi:hypothetical protein
MTIIIDTIRKPKTWFIVSVVYIWLFGLGKLFATIGPPYTISRIADKSFSFTGMVKAFLLYAQEAATSLGCKYEYVVYVLIMNVLIFVPVIILGFFILRRKLWALNASIILLVVYIANSVGLGLVLSKSLFDVVTLDIAILFVIVIFFMNKSTKAIFNEKNI